MTDLPAALGPYRITGLLGRGGMGVVYSGQHRDTGVVAALKTVDSADSQKLAWIRQEIHALARLDHPGVVRILDHGVSAGQPWYAMEQLDGQTLADVFDRLWSAGAAGDGGASLTSAVTVDDLDRQAEDEEASTPAGGGGGAGAAALREALGILQRVCEALAYVHGEGVVHRDLKPGNIFVRRNGLPVLVDFGLVANAGGSIGREVVDPMQRIAGSPPYMPPEQLRGDLLDARADLYSVGCVLYHLLTGAPPFTGRREEVIQGHLQGAVIPPSLLVDDVSEELDRLVLSLLAKDRDDRLGYAETVAHILGEQGAQAPAWAVATAPPRPYLYRPAFVGRRTSLAVIRDRLDWVGNHGSLVLVAGESGAGKTRLALEASTLARRNKHQVITGECLPSGAGEAAGQALQPLRPLIQSIADQCIEGGESERLLGDRAAVLATYFPELRSLPGLAALADPDPLPPQAARNRLFRCLAETLSAAAGRPLLLVLDDLQWADDLTMGFLQHLAQGALEVLPVVVLGTFRSEERTEALDGLVAISRVTTLNLAHMGGEEVGEMAGGMLALRSPPADFVRFLADRSSGNPFFLAEYLRGAVAEGVLARDRDGRWSFVATGSLSAAYESLPLPHSLRQLIELRLEKLGPVTRRVLDTAVLMGRDLRPDVLQEVEDLDEAALLEVIDEMLRRQVVEPGEQGGFRFLHDKIREVAEAQQDGDDQRRRHQRIAEVLERHALGQPAGTGECATIGRHWSRAQRPDQALPHLRRAAEQAQRIHAVGEAINLFRDALRELAAIRASRPDLAEERRLEAAALNETLGDLLALQGRNQEARAAFAAAMADSGGFIVTVSRLQRKTAKTYELEHRHDDALAAHIQAENCLRLGTGKEEGWRREWIQIKLDRVFVFYWLAKVAEMEAELAVVAPFINTDGLPSHRYHYYMSLVNMNNRRYRYRISGDTLDHADRLLAAAEEIGTGPEMAFGRFMHGFTLLLAGQVEAAEADLIAAKQASRRIGDVAGEILAAAYIAVAYRRQGRIEAARQAAEDLLKTAEAAHMHHYRGVALAILGWAAWRLGDLETGREQSWQAIEVWRGLPTPYPFSWIAALTVLRCDLDQGPLERLVEQAERLHHPPQVQLPDPLDGALAEVLSARGDEPTCRAALAWVGEVAEMMGYL